MDNGTLSVEEPPYPSWNICGSCFRRMRMLIPVGFKSEVIELAKLAGPVTMAQFMSFMVSFISTVFCGHLGKTELAGVTLAIARKRIGYLKWLDFVDIQEDGTQRALVIIVTTTTVLTFWVINVTGVSIGFGLASACDTLISQTFGSRNLLQVGVILQRGILILLLACFPCWALLINTEPILWAVKQSPEVARISQLYVKIFMPALPATFMYSLQSKYLQNQGIIWPQVITGAAVNVLNAVINYIFLYALKLGVAGSAVANTLSQFSMASILYAYIRWKGLHKATWGGWSTECLQDWGSFIRLAVPSMVMLCVEWWTYEIGGFLAGLISEVELGAQSVVYELANVAYMFPLGFSVAGSVRVGQALGAGDTEQAKLTAKLTMFCAGSVSVCLSVVVGSLKDHISYVFSYDEQIRERVAEIMAFYAPFLLLDAMSAASGSIIRGAGKQKVGAICNIVGYYGVGFPIGVPLMFAAKLGIKGLWIGLFVCVFLQCSVLITYLSRMNWNAVMVEAKIRAGVLGASIDTGLGEGNADTQRISEVVDGAAVTTAERLLSHRDLVLRRGLALAVMLFILAVGVITNVLITSLVS